MQGEARLPFLKVWDRKAPRLWILETSSGASERSLEQVAIMARAKTTTAVKASRPGKAKAASSSSPSPAKKSTAPKKLAKVEACDNEAKIEA